MKVRTVRSEGDIDQLIELVSKSAEKALLQIAKSTESRNGLQALWSIKFAQIACDPLDSESPLNLIEQLNQTFTYLASAKALRLLLQLHPELAPYRVNLGTSPGSDIESGLNEGLAAEVFAAVNTSNNRKLAKDIAKVHKTSARLKYVFFMCPGYEVGRQPKLERDGVQVWSVGEAL
jgi:flagellar motor switch protein FliG